MTTVLAVRGLTVTFPKRPPVVAGIDFDVLSGRTLGVVGESGCGKTLTALAVMGLVPRPGQVGGSVRLNGLEMIGQAPADWTRTRGAKVAMVFQEPMTALNPVMSVGKQIAEVMVLHESLSWREAGEKAIDALAAVGITSPRQRAGAYPHQLSGGMRQRVMIAMALACRPALLIADEPTTALDVTIQAQILDLMQGLQQQIGMAIEFISHNLAVVSQVADEIIVMYAGRVVERASAAALFATPLHPYTLGLIATLPDPDRRSAELSVIPGGVPNLDEAVPGCRFADRCDRAVSACRLAEPALDAVAPGHFVACFRAGA
jgi:oligopeptide/dipeptide ABC transporter ATP-binding protein